jgi:hypothetical protein
MPVVAPAKSLHEPYRPVEEGAVYSGAFSPRQHAETAAESAEVKGNKRREGVEKEEWD